MNRECVHQGVALLLHVLHHLGPALLAGQVLHEAALQGEPDSTRGVEEQGLPDQAEGNPLVEGVEDLRNKNIWLSPIFSPLLHHRPSEICGHSSPNNFVALKYDDQFKI